ncbi:MAG: GNAT family N-acetyltransferase [Actinomycetota bacterium]
MRIPTTGAVELPDGRRIAIRPARAADARGWIDLLRTISQEDRYILLEEITTSRRELARIFRFGSWTSESAAIVAAASDRVIGQLTTTRNRNIQRHTAEIGMSVLAPYRGMGIGEALIKGAEQWARAFAVEKLCLNVVPDNTRAIRFYEKVGFQKEGYRTAQAKLSYGYEDLMEMGMLVRPE